MNSVSIFQFPDCSRQLDGSGNQLSIALESYIATSKKPKLTDPKNLA